jgi:NTE family protein
MSISLSFQILHVMSTKARRPFGHLFTGLLLLAPSLLLLTPVVPAGAQTPSPLPLPKQQSERPKVGVVLSGGGAKGMAHIGALKVIEAAGVPVDYVVGTSMGSIIGGLYAIGYTPMQMDSIVRRQDWSLLLSDRVPRSEQNLLEREASERYVLSMPLRGKGTKPEMFGGLIKGLNLANLFSELTVGYHDSINFNHLPIPFACVSEDVVTGNEIDFHSGVLAQAMRASMAIPGVFAPVRMGQRVLIDGGVTNNYPVDVARQMGADIVIGVDVQSELKPADELNSTGSILGQLVNLMGQDMYEMNIDQTDIYIKVNVDGYSSASFNRKDIDTLIVRGEEAARLKRDTLQSLAARLTDNGTLPRRLVPEYPYTEDRKVNIRHITFEGLDDDDKRWLMKRCGLKEDSETELRQIERANAVLCANLGYASATYSLPQVGPDTYDLRFALQKQVENRVNVGIRFDSEEIAALMVNATKHFDTKVPSTAYTTVRLGKRYAANLRYSLELAPLKALSLSYLWQYNDIDLYHQGEHTHSYTFRYHQAELAFSDVWYRNLRFNLGTRYELYDYGKFFQESENAPSYDVDSEHFFSYFFQMQYETQDRAYFPSKGVSLKGAFSMYTDDFIHYADHSPFYAVRTLLQGVVPVTHRFSVLPAVYGRFLIGHDIPYSKLNAIGGEVAGRFLTQQLPFVGINNVQLTGNALLVGSLKLRQRLGSIHYLTLTQNYALSSEKWTRLNKGDAMYGCGIGYGMNSMFGPLEASLNYANHADKVSLYINLGYYF